MDEATLRERARQIMARCDELARCSEDVNRLTRPYGTDALRRAQETVAGWMREAGLAVRRDAIGNLIGRYDGASSTARTLLLGSHLDSVRDAGRYDGPLGVLDCVARLARRGERPPFALEVVAFADEEGLRFHSLYLGSRAFAGTLDRATLAATDAAGITVAEAIRAFGGDPDAIPRTPRDGSAYLGYSELHIEQGPVLERGGLPVGIVSGFAGQSKLAIAFQGEAGHAGTLPMALRRDALCAAAEFVLAVEAIARETDGLVATVGQLTVAPGASNVVPGSATLSLDVRHRDGAIRVDICRRVQERATEIAVNRGVGLDWWVVQENPAVACDPALTAALERAVAVAGHPVRRLASGAGHDAVALSAIMPVAMLFVRCRGGISHNPAEAVAPDDVAAALSVLDRFVAGLAVGVV